MVEIPPSKKFTASRVIVAGDVMLDSYLEGETNRVSPEAPVVILDVRGQQNRLGGAGNVALNLAAWGVRTSLFAICGKDAEGQEVDALVRKSSISNRLIFSSKLTTTRKLRVVAQQQLLRLDFEGNGQEVAPLLTKKLVRSLRNDSILVLSDYNKGALAQVEEIIKEATKKKMFVLIDPKRADFSCYRGASLLTPNYAEFCRSVGGCADYEEMIKKGREMVGQLSLQALLVTCGADGMFLIQADKVYNFPAYNREVYDITGAGDTVIATLAAGIGAGMSLHDATELCSFAAGLSVSKKGTGVIGYDHVVRNVHRKLFYSDIEDLLKEIEQARANNQKIVFTNGVFDVLHSGHIFYLDQAARLGDKLVIGINSDKSARRLKGKNRPINDLASRATVLNSLRMVDWIISFDEPTPRTLITSIKPDFLVKGGDYRSKEDVVGSDIVEGYGGQVKILGYLEGQSTSAILARGYQKKL